ncbi:ATP-binding protein [Acinetobacter baumannii]|uniref:ATP-binding protein n=1 Tax=Acinetobacter baumannii TaxID=470 RepID=UPI001CDB964B|nr:ATP-binding protein [Acinetobacter baumannii]MCA4293366.1 ATP-binding protein [Acinetobacter baumannii]
MALPIITADQTLLVQAIIVYLYADPGLGKSSMGFTAEKAISFDFGRGAHRTGELRRGAVVQVQQWSDVANLTPQDLAPYKTVVIDTVGAMLECIKTHLLLTANNRQKDGSLKLKAQGLANQTFKQYINTLISLGKDVVFIAHASEDQNGDQIIYRPDLGGKNRNELYRIADVMGYLTTVTTGEGKNARVINFKPSPTHHAKNSGALGGETGEVWVPDLKAHPTFLADLITQAKDHINTLTPAQLAAAKAQEELENWKQSCEEAEHAGDLNQLTESLDKEHMYYQNMRQAMLMRAKALNCTFDKQRGTWISPPEFNGISDQQRDELQNFIAERGLDVKTVCEHFGIDALIQIEAAKLTAVKQEIETLAKTGMTA